MMKDVNKEYLEMSFEDSYRYHTICARATLFPGKTIDEVIVIIDNNLKKLKLN